MPERFKRGLVNGFSFLMVAVVILVSLVSIFKTFIVKDTYHEINNVLPRNEKIINIQRKTLYEYEVKTFDESTQMEHIYSYDKNSKKIHLTIKI